MAIIENPQGYYIDPPRGLPLQISTVKDLKTTWGQSNIPLRYTYTTLMNASVANKLNIVEPIK